MRRLLLATLAILAPFGAAHAVCPPIPYVFANGSAIDATKANANWTALRNCFNSTPGVFGPGATQISDVASWNDTVGALLKNTGTTRIRGGAATFLFSPDSTTQNQLTYTATTSGNQTTAPTDSGYAPFWWAKQTTTGTGLGVNKGVVMAEFDIDDNGTVVNNDSFVGVAGSAILRNTRANAGIAGGTLAAAAVGGSMSARGIASQGGNLGASMPQGEIHGLNVVAGVSNIGPSVPANYIDHEGIEVDMVGCVGCTVKYRIGLYSVDFGNGAGGSVEQGTNVDAALAIGSVAGTAGWKYGIDFAGTDLIAGNAVDPVSGTALGSSAGSPTIAKYGIDLNNFVISDFAFRGPAGSFTVSGTGAVGAALSIQAGAGFISTAADNANAVIEFRSTTVAKWDVGREATTNDFIVKDVAGGDVNLRITAAGVSSLGATNPVSVDSTGVFSVPGGGQTIGAPTGGAKGAGSLNFAGTLWANGTQGIATCSVVTAGATITIKNGIITAFTGC